MFFSFHGDCLLIAKIPNVRVYFYRVQKRYRHCPRHLLERLSNQFRSLTLFFLYLFHCRLFLCIFMLSWCSVAFTYQKCPDWFQIELMPFLMVVAGHIIHVTCIVHRSDYRRGLENSFALIISLFRCKLLEESRDDLNLLHGRNCQMQVKVKLNWKTRRHWTTVSAFWLSLIMYLLNNWESVSGHGSLHCRLDLFNQCTV